MTTTRTEPWYYSASLLPVGTPVPPQSATNRHAVDIFQKATAPLLSVLWGVKGEPKVRFFQPDLTSLTYEDKASFLIDTRSKTIDHYKDRIRHYDQMENMLTEVAMNALRRLHNEPEPFLVYVAMFRKNPPRSKKWDFNAFFVSEVVPGVARSGFAWPYVLDLVQAGVEKLLPQRVTPRWRREVLPSKDT